MIVARLGRDRACEGGALPHARAGGRSGARSRRSWSRALKAQRQGDLCGAARQPSARADAGGARRLRPARRCRHPDARARSVLLRGVNDDAETLGGADARLRREPHQALLPAPRRPRARHRASAHHDRRGPGADARACAAALSGLCQPTYVLDIPGGHGKAPIGPGYLRQAASGCEIEDYRGGRHIYPPGS